MQRVQVIWAVSFGRVLNFERERPLISTGEVQNNWAGVGHLGAYLTGLKVNLLQQPFQVSPLSRPVVSQYALLPPTAAAPIIGAAIIFVATTA